MKLAQLKEEIRGIIRERSVNAIQKELGKIIAEMQYHLELYKKSKGTPEEKKHIKHLSDLTKKKKNLQKELDSAVAGLYRNAELKVDESFKVEFGKVYSNPFHNAFKPLKEEEDHEVFMAQNSLDSIIKNATELKGKIGEQEKDLPAWIQDHITNSENYIEQANGGYHELGESKLNEAAEIKFEKLTPIHQKQVKAFEKILNGKHSVIFEGIHGIIVDIKVSNPMGVYRFDADDLKKLLALKIRWVEGDKNTITIGF